MDCRKCGKHSSSTCPVEGHSGGSCSDMDMYMSECGKPYHKLCMEQLTTRTKIFRCLTCVVNHRSTTSRRIYPACGPEGDFVSVKKRSDSIEKSNDLKRAVLNFSWNKYDSRTGEQVTQPMGIVGCVNCHGPGHKVRQCPADRLYVRMSKTTDQCRSDSTLALPLPPAFTAGVIVTRIMDEIMDHYKIKIPIVLPKHVAAISGCIFANGLACFRCGDPRHSEGLDCPLGSWLRTHDRFVDFLQYARLVSCRRAIAELRGDFIIPYWDFEEACQVYSYDLDGGDN